MSKLGRVKFATETFFFLKKKRNVVSQQSKVEINKHDHISGWEELFGSKKKILSPLK